MAGDFRVTVFGYQYILGFILRAIHRAGRVAFQGAVGHICMLDAAISTSSSRASGVLRLCRADLPA